MSQALEGEHYCIRHQGNHSHYDEKTCTVGKLEKQLAERDAALARCVEALGTIELEASMFRVDPPMSEDELMDKFEAISNTPPASCTSSTTHCNLSTDLLIFNDGSSTYRIVAHITDCESCGVPDANDNFSFLGSAQVTFGPYDTGRSCVPGSDTLPLDIKSRIRPNRTPFPDHYVPSDSSEEFVPTQTVPLKTRCVDPANLDYRIPKVILTGRNGAKTDTRASGLNSLLRLPNSVRSSEGRNVGLDTHRLTQGLTSTSNVNPPTGTTLPGSHTRLLSHFPVPTLTSFCMAPTRSDRKLADFRVDAAVLVTPSTGTITEAGVRKNIRVAIQYLAAWLSGNGCVPIDNLMEDAATAEISRAQVWQWINSPNGVLNDGRKVTKEMVHAMLPEEIEKIRALYGEANFAASKIAQAAQVFERVVTEEQFEDFLTLVAYEYLE